MVDATHQRLVIIQNNVLSVCDSLPGQPGTTCAGILVFSGEKGRKQSQGIYRYRRDDDNEDAEGDNDDDDKVVTILASPSSNPTTAPATRPSTTRPSPTVFKAPQQEDGGDQPIYNPPFTETKLATTTKMATVTSVVASTPSSTALRDTLPTAAAAVPLVLEETCVLSLEWLNETCVHNVYPNESPFDSSLNFQASRRPARRRRHLFVRSLAVCSGACHGTSDHSLDRPHVQPLIMTARQILTESIPHLVTALLGHALGAGWAAYRLASTKSLERFYKDHIMPEACASRDLMGEWWTARIHHAVCTV